MAAAGVQKQTRGKAWRVAAAVVCGLLVIASLATAFVADKRFHLKPGPDEYNVAAWEVRNIPGKWVFLAGQLLRGSPGEAEQDATLRRFFELNNDIDDLSRQASEAGNADPELNSQLAALEDERSHIENQVEATIESRLTSVINEKGITRDFLINLVWPPVDAEFTEAPRALARSPRDHIELLGSYLLREDLTLAQAEAIENEVAQRENVSALSFSTAGIGAYPTIIDYPGDYQRALEVIAHEWVHNYLFFRPLGFNYFTNNDIRTMNETVADLVGRELAQAVMARWPLESPAPAPATSSSPPRAGIDLRAELRQLRGEVDDLLAAGKIDEAEALMEARRQELAGEGYYIRKINQAYFAYLNLYAGEAGSAAATNPIGPKIDELRQRSASLKQFVDIVGSITSVNQLDAALQRLEQPG